jgi:alpha-tubulin suppressor-like RCC1 family protein
MGAGARRVPFGSAAAIALLVGVAACPPRVATETIVDLHAEAGLLAAARTLRVHVQNDEGTAVLDRDVAVSATADPLARVPLVPKGGDPTRRFALHATLLDGSGAALADLRANAGYRDSELLELNLSFEDACRGRPDCGDGRTCQFGECVGSCFDPGPAGNTTVQAATCGECERCGSTCQAIEGLSCGCPGETCASGTCVPKVRVLNVDAGEFHTCAGLEDGTVRCWGSTTFEDGKTKGRLGTGPGGADSTTPVVAQGATCGRGLTSSSDFTCCIDPSARFCWGVNDVGELGGAIGPVAQVPHAFQDPFLLESIASGFRHACGVTGEGQLWCWGFNGSGNLGLGTSTPDEPPTETGTGYTQVAAGGDHTCAVTLDGQMKCWGLNDSGEVGVPGGKTMPLPARSGCEAASSGQACFHDWKAVGAGAFHTCGIRESGDLYCWGGNQNGQVGIGPPTSSFQQVEPKRIAPSGSAGAKWVDVDGGHSHTCALTTAGTLYCWGLNEDRQLGIPGADLIDTPTAVPVDAPDGWRSLGLGLYHSCAIRADRALYCWGRNSDGQVGVGVATPAPISRPTRVCF